MYTSLLNVKEAIVIERNLINYLRTYIDHEVQRLEDIKRFHAKVSDLHNGVYDGPAMAMANPLLAFTLIKRLQSEWLNVVYSNEASENTQALRSGFEAVEASLPKLEDLQGAAKGLMRLQDVYALQVGSLARGRFQRAASGDPVDIYLPAVSVPFSGDDCFLVGKVAYELGDYYHAVPWLEESVHLFRGDGGEWSPENQGTLEDALDHLAFSHFKNVEKYEKLLVESTSLSIRGGMRRPNSTYLRTRNDYESLCQTHGSQPKNYENPRLSCDFFSNGDPGLLLQPMRREVLSLRPYVVLYHNFITNQEAEDMKTVSQQGMDRRIARLTGLNVANPYGEYLQVVNYGIGGHYEPHFDHATLSSVEAGGATAFIYANFSVPVVENAALFWWNLHRNGRGDENTLHGGCPVLVGDKWVANKWIHEHGQEFRRRCTLNPEE
ncbi:hypothetical protein NHX12_008427 [Muraenolepis orangiensis]|uniref:procollagen-proline 4-dioxygenase n=1 Tax=Muraenolepis orangiensis TaxID=630683 RepID=A0A9Q0DMV0_9TELE|nr:hypothetical protein NHX12_008427 [Muraenolepis orangiensis]